MPATPENCPNCGADLPRSARVCPECGSDENTGWSEAAETQDLNLPDGNFDYDEFVRTEFGAEDAVKPRGMKWIWWLVALGVIAGFVLLILASR